MLARATKPVYVCLRCRRNLSRDKFNSSTAAEFFTTPAPRRWQSVAVRHLALDDDDDENHDSGDVSNNSNQAFNRPKPHWPRKWMPEPTTELGVDSLGKPTEVLLLPSRDRRIPRVPQSEEKEKVSGTTLHDSINSERAPLSGRKLVENIEQVRNLVGKMRGQLEKHEWTKLRINLTSGFQKAQLVNYLRLRKAEFSPGFPKNNPSKEEIMKFLVEEIWGFTIPSQDESRVRKAGKVKLGWNLRDPAKLKHLITHSTQPLKRIAEQNDVQVDVYASQSRLRVSGGRDDANRALRALVSYTKNFAVRQHTPYGSAGIGISEPRTEGLSQLVSELS